MRFVSWNVNGLRACMQKGFMDFFTAVNADFFCLQETKLQEGQIELDLPGYEQYWNYAEKKGYSGTAIFTKHTPLSVNYGMGIPELDTEGRLITLEYPEFYLVTCYTPNAQRGLARIDHRLKWEEAFRDYLSNLDSKKPVILCGDLNVAHKEIDLKNPGSNRGNAGFSDEERDAFTKLLERGFTDSFRHLNPETTGAYTWWSYMFNARQNNAGWRIDYFVVSERANNQIFSTPIYSDILGSDHCPVGLDMDIACNGGIWPSFENPEPPKTEEIPEKNSSGVKAAAIALCAVLLVASVFYTFPNKEPSPTEPAAETHPIGQVLTRWSVATKEIEYRYTGSSAMSSVIKINGFRDGDKVYETETISIPNGLNFWIRIDAIDPELLKTYDLKATLVDKAQFEKYHDETDTYCDVVNYFDDNGNFAGWFIFGYVQRDAYAIIELWDEQGMVQKMSLKISPIISEEMASIRSTEYLINYVLHHEVFESNYFLDNHLDLDNDTYVWLWQYYPGFLELCFRDDAITLLAAHKEKYPSCEDTANNLISIISDVSEYYSAYKDRSVVLTFDNVSLVSHILAQENLMECVDDLMQKSVHSHTAYLVLRALQPALAYLETRENAHSELLERYDRSPLIKFILMHPEFLSNFTIDEANVLLEKISNGNGIESVSTDDLIKVITTIQEVRNSLLFSNYEILLEKFPAMRELEKREDAVQKLHSTAFEIGRIVTADQEVVARALLRQEVYYEKLSDDARSQVDNAPILYSSSFVGP